MLFWKNKKKSLDECASVPAYNERPVSWQEFNDLRERLMALTNFLGLNIYKPYGYTVAPRNNAGSQEVGPQTAMGSGISIRL